MQRNPSRSSHRPPKLLKAHCSGYAFVSTRRTEDQAIGISRISKVRLLDEAIVADTEVPLQDLISVLFSHRAVVVIGLKRAKSIKGIKILLYNTDLQLIGPLKLPDRAYKAGVSYIHKESLLFLFGITGWKTTSSYAFDLNIGRCKAVENLPINFNYGTATSFEETHVVVFGVQDSSNLCADYDIETDSWRSIQLKIDACLYNFGLLVKGSALAVIDNRQSRIFRVNVQGYRIKGRLRFRQAEDATFDVAGYRLDSGMFRYIEDQYIVTNRGKVNRLPYEATVFQIGKRGVIWICKQMQDRGLGRLNTNALRRALDYL